MFPDTHPLHAFITEHTAQARAALARGDCYALQSAEPVVAEIVERLGPGSLARRFSGQVGWVLSRESSSAAKAARFGIAGPDFACQTSLPLYEETHAPSPAQVLRPAKRPVAPAATRDVIYGEYQQAARASGITRALTDSQWRAVAVCFPRRSEPERKTLDAFLHMQRTNATKWSGLPAGQPLTSVKERLAAWHQSGALRRALEMLRADF